MGAHDQDNMRAIFQESLRPFSVALREYAVAVADRPALPSADSDAMHELYGEQEWATPDWKQPARNAHSYGRLLCHHLIDHADSYAAIAASAWLGPSFAHASILRSVMEVATTAGWLLEPNIGTEKRIQRSTVYRIDSAVNLGRMNHVDSAADTAREGLRRAIDYAVEVGWGPGVNLPNGGRKSIGGEAMPFPDSGFSEVAFGLPNERFDRMLWNYLSAQTHGTFYAVAQVLSLPPGIKPDPLDADGTVRAVGASSSNVLTLGGVLFCAVRSVVERRDILNGWTATAEELDAAQRVAKLTTETSVSFAP